MLTLRPRPRSGPAVALVISGNASFAAGPRRELFDWLRQEEMKLLKDAGRH